MYDYLKAIKNDVEDYIKDNLSGDLYSSRDDMEQTLNDLLWIDDDVTGNGSGSYYCDAYKAKEALLGDDNSEKYIQWLISDFCIDSKTIAEKIFDWKYWDTSIRCYLLGQAIGEVLDVMEETEEILDYIEEN